jgi:hypothetical protein
VSATSTAAAELQPLTERILARLPGRRAIWIGVWALVPWLNFAANEALGIEGAVWDQSRALVVGSYAAVSFAVIVTLWGTGRIADRVDQLLATTATVCPGCTSRDFREMNSVRLPLVAAGVTAVGFGVTALVSEGAAAGAIRAPTWFMLGVAFWSYLSTYVALQRGLDRLGRERLRPAPLDPTLGLKPLGDVAFMGLWILLLWLVPILLTGLPDAVGVGVGLLVVAGGLTMFFLSLWRLHRQMVEVKTSELAVARDLYGEAYAPVRRSKTLAVLEEQRNLLSAADSLEKRAASIHEWPIDESTLARVITITTSVTAVILARLILAPVGL